MEEDDDSILSGSEEGNRLVEEAFEIAWDCSISQVGGDADWAPTAQAHRAAIDLLGSVLNSSTKRHIDSSRPLMRELIWGAKTPTTFASNYDNYFSRFMNTRHWLTLSMLHWRRDMPQPNPSRI